MINFTITITERQKELIKDAIDMADKSNKRMQQTKPQFKAIFDAIAGEIAEIRTMLLNARASDPPPPAKIK